MPPQRRIWQELTWSWAYSTGNPASDQKLEAATKAAWPYAILCAWTFLNDHDAAHDLMNYAVQNTSSYVGRHPDCADKKLTLHLKSVIKRRARQQSAKRSREIQYGSLIDLEKLYIGQPEAEQRVSKSSSRSPSVTLETRFGSACPRYDAYHRETWGTGMVVDGDLTYAGISLVSLLSAGIGAYFGAYLKKKGENLATHEDFNDLKKQTGELTQATKEIEAKISDELWAGQRQWEMKRDAAVGTLESYQRFRDASGRFVSADDEYNKKGAEFAESMGEERVKAAVEWRQAFNKLVDVLNILLFVGSPVTRMYVGSFCELLLRLNETPAHQLGKELSSTSKDVSDGFESIRHSLRGELGLVDGLDFQEMVAQKMNAAMRLTKRSSATPSPDSPTPE
jgi:hypothetical protein